MNSLAILKEEKELKERASGQREKILLKLRENGCKGVTNVYFYKHVTRSLGARLSELNERGYGIQTKNLGHGVYKYVLISEPLTPGVRFERAEDILMREIEERKFVTASEIKSILQQNGFIISRKGGSKKLRN
ncbi:hypothetical protein [Stenotrophomonas maltophilia group sp. RNC7]|uniref:hypothetical protein n=1 Tax=Stenotrophomonas maltophilia group sp. RNC7 TaxID=3071467 RepID=UPI0027E1E5D8|nr:hypothetical protein [Stenotrophomonas maltophilia group sp. RNC7]MDQ4682044.1 hypothetical protein [Stenotrophomonas maltophilia group sp. RNC7]